MRKLIVLLFVCILTPLINAYEFASPEVKEKVSGIIDASKTQADEAAYDYGYKPIVFKLTTEYYRDLYLPTYTGGRANMNYKQGFIDEVHTANCYATLINNEYLLTYKDCVFYKDIPVDIEDCQGCFASFKPASRTFSYDGREASVKPIEDAKYYVDERSGAVLINIKDFCLNTVETKASNVCIRLLDWIGGGVEKFSFKDNYGTIILSNIDSRDKVEDSFTKRTFFTPVSEDRFINVKSVSKGIVETSRTGKTYAGEPLFHRLDGKRNMLVGMTVNTLPYKFNKTVAGQYIVFSPYFTSVIKHATKGKGVILTKDFAAISRL